MAPPPATSQELTVQEARRCQYQSAKWAAELLDALPDDDLGLEETSVTDVFNTQIDPVEARLEQNELPKYLMAKSLLDCHEMRRCAAAFLSTDSSEHTIPLQNNVLNISHGKLSGSVFSKTSQKGLFLASHALLLAGEKQKTEELGPILGPSDTGAVINKQLAPLKRMLKTWFDQEAGNRRSQGWLEYLYGFPHSESIVLGLTLNQVQSKLRPHIMAFIFSVYCRQELHQSSTTLISEISQLQSVFPRSLFLQGQRALVFYRMKDFHTANTLFSQMLISSPFHLDFLPHHSNILHTLSSQSQLAFLTHLSTSISRYRPKTHVAMGNYYSLTLRHSSAIQAFRLALQLDRNFTAAWTLLGHEYYKVENTHAAIAAYMRAVEGDCNDYRAFVGLGVVYERLERPTLSLHYYRRAMALRPDDGEVWGIMGSCLGSMGRVIQGIEALKRAITCSGYGTGKNQVDELGDRCKRIELFFQLDNAYEEGQDRTEATKYLEICVEESDEVEGSGDMDVPLPTATVSVINRSRLLLAQWFSGGRR
ncbi:hypothetical protein VE02_03279 [Pseudogymnoascus sp. 03VT05]|nr:hypothetical protein VE02_03279 [Pseudogymnoascus sp. 03VT05]